MARGPRSRRRGRPCLALADPGPDGAVIGGVDVALAERWIRSVLEPAGPLELERQRPWATVFRVPLRDGRAWFKACRPVQAFEPALTAGLAARWPDRVAGVLAHDPDRAWLLTAHAGQPVGEHGNAPELWLRALPLYAELQRGETRHVDEHLASGVPDHRVETLPGRYAALLATDLPIEAAEVARLRRFEPRFTELCAELAGNHALVSIQHDDLHLRSLFLEGETLRVLDWGDASIAHPFASLVVTFRFLEEVNGLEPADPWFDRLRDAYLEPWGGGLEASCALAMRVGTVAQAFGWARHREAMTAGDRSGFDPVFAELLRRILARVVDPASRSERSTLRT